jgi:uncharacterized protein (DUF1810 family)
MMNLERFVAAQDAGGTYHQALREVSAGQKRSHWMWFVFPQIAGLGASAMAMKYAIASLDEARAYLAHPVLGPRYRACVAALAALPEANAVKVFGGIDAKKLRSSLTLFARADPTDTAIRSALERWFGGEEDPATVGRIG